MVVFVVVTPVGWVHTDDILCSIYRLFPNFQLDVVRAIHAGLQLNHFEIEEVAIHLIPVRFVAYHFFVQPLDVLRNDAGLKERITRLNERLLRSPRLVLIQQRGFGTSRFRFPPYPS